VGGRERERSIGSDKVDEFVKEGKSLGYFFWGRISNGSKI
jgi:phosphosulfolactate synthase (CoM biosynthesis protein A)